MCTLSGWNSLPASQISWRHRSEIWILLLNSVTIFRWSIVARKVEMGQYFWYTVCGEERGLKEINASWTFGRKVTVL